ncbi:MAG: HDOD domain-containing protein [Magnetococcales bacterium]|nr:HDOD domain-containing protein [Magnetococcales bacterium]NGZ26573.1 HDOD domain-containing protein [Magnetococcales bacterium]
MASNRVLDRMIEASANLVSLPDVFHRINAAVEHPFSTLDQIAAIIMEDPGLTARLLKIANSSFYGLPHPVETISRALTVVGTRQLRDLVMATVAVNQFNGVPDNLLNISDFWRHSITCGLAARVIATYRREANVESFYVAGLLHDVGRLLFFMIRPEVSAKLMEDAKSQGLLLHQVEKQSVGFDHAEIGGALLAKWKLPDRLCQMVRWHHQPSLAESHMEAATVIHIADILAQSLRRGFSGEWFVPPLDVKAWESSGLSPNMIPTIAKQVEKQYGVAVHLFA